MKRRIPAPVLTPKHFVPAETRSPPPAPIVAPAKAEIVADAPPTVALEETSAKGWTVPWRVSPLVVLGVGLVIVLMTALLISARLEVHRLSVQQQELMTAVLQRLRAF